MYIKKGILFICFILLALPVWAASYGSIDNRAKKLPIRLAETKEQVVEELTKGMTSEEDKARAIAAFLAYQVQRNGYEDKIKIQASGRNRLADPPMENDVFKSRLGTPQEFADLYTELATLAGLQAVTITGYAGRNVPAYRYKNPALQSLEPMMNRSRGGDYKLQRYIAAWNAVKIKGKWELVDTYWMINGEIKTGQEKNERAMRSFIQKRTKKTPSLATLTQNKAINNDYFMADPRKFIKTHFPNEDEWQLLPTPKKWNSFTK